MASPHTVGDDIVVAVDQGTGSTKAIAIDAAGAVLAQASHPVSQRHPRPGWVEQDATEILDSVRQVLSTVRRPLGERAYRIVGLGLSTQRESAVIWDRKTGEPLGPVLGWQDRRTRSFADQLLATGADAVVREVTGLPLDPMFSALKFRWLLDQIDPDRSRSRRGEIGLGTIDAWLSFALTGEFVIEAGNASRTQLMELNSVSWSEDMLELFDVPRSALPEITASQRVSAKVTETNSLFGMRMGAVLADSHAALYAHGARIQGDLKVTYGTGSSVMGLTGGASVPDGLVRTLAWSADTAHYAYEGNILSTGGTLIWVASLFQMTADELCEPAEQSTSSHAIELVPAFAGLGAPWWDDAAEGLVSGLTLGTDRSAIARAAMESIALQIEDVLASADAIEPVERVFVDGGPTANSWLMTLQADLSQRTVIRSDVPELSAVGAAQMAGIGLDCWDENTVLNMPRPRTEFSPSIDPERADARKDHWHAAVRRARGQAVQSFDVATN